MGEQEKATILIVDDKVKNAYVFENLLQGDERKLITVTSGKEALKTALNNDIDLIILDVQMPDMDGFEVAQILKTNNRTKNIPIIFATAERTEHESMMKGFEEGGVDYLFKPINPEVTKAKVSVLLQLHLQKKELIAKNQALEKSSLLINNSADIICILNARTLEFEEVNKALTAFTGIDSEKLLGTSLLSLLPFEEKEKVKKLKERIEDYFSFETWLFIKKKEKRCLNWNIVNKDGLWFANARDITRIREAEEIKNYLAIVVKQSNEAIYMYNPEGRIISWNIGAEKIYGFSEEEALKMNIWNIVPEHLMKETQSIINKLAEDKEVKAYETKRTTKFGKIIDVIFSASVITGSNGELKSIAITEYDITERKKAEDSIKQLNTELKSNLLKLESSNKELEAFSYSVSHDLRAPLRHITGFADLLTKDYRDEMPDKVKHYLDNITHSAKQMGILIDDLLQFSRNNRSELTKTVFNMGDVLDDVLAQTKHLTQKRRIDWRISSLPEVSADFNLIRMVMTNLVENALKYTRTRKLAIIEIGCKEENEEFIFYIRDNGVGFDMKYAQKLFGVFQRLHSDKEFEGTGIGLANVRRIISRHDGRTWAEAEPDKGAAFYFSLPK